MGKRIPLVQVLEWLAFACNVWYAVAVQGKGRVMNRRDKIVLDLLIAGLVFAVLFASIGILKRNAERDYNAGKRTIYRTIPASDLFRDI